MDPKFKEIFKKRIFHEKFLEIFDDIAKTFTSDSIEALYKDVNNRNTPLSFTEINQYATRFNDELIRRSEAFRQDYKENNGAYSSKLTRGSKKIIGNCMKQYLLALEQASSSRPSSVIVKSYPQEVA